MILPLLLTLASTSPTPAALAPGRTFFLSPAGDDARDGRSTRAAWRSLERVGREGLRPGDSVVLLDGGTFEGHLELTEGDPARPIVIRSGEGPRGLPTRRRATIVATGAPAIAVRAGGVRIHDLVLRGTAKAKTAGNEGILLAAPKERSIRGIRIDRVEIAGMGAPGISGTGEKGTPYGVDDVRITHANVHGNYGVGILTGDGIAYDSGGTRYGHHDWRIVDCDTSENFDGAGIILGGMDRALVEFCRSANNRNPEGGGLGMWAWCSRRVTFRHDIGSGTRSKGDGGGFDLDGGTADCVVERCLSFDNVGPGYMHCDFPSAPRTMRNVMRDNVSVDDGHSENGGPAGFGFVVWGSGLYDCRIERNLAVITRPIARRGDSAAMFATFIRDGSTAIENQRLEGAVFRDNAVVATVPGVYFVRDSFPVEVKKEIVYRGNAYRGTAPFVLGLEGGIRYETAADWRAATGDAAREPNVRPIVDGLAALRPRDLPAFLRRLGR